MSATVSPPANAVAAVPSNFNGMTRRKVIPFGTLTKPTGGNATTFTALPRTGYLSRLYIAIRGTVAGGAITSPNALGMASIIRRVRLTLNSGLDVINISGPGYHYLLRQSLDQSGFDPLSQSNARSAVTATTFNLDMVIPIALNLRDPLGLLLLQSESTLVTFSIDWESDTTVGTGATVTGTAVIWGEIFTVPASPTDQPPTNVVQQILEETIAIAGAGAVTYVWPRGGLYLQLFHGYGFGVSGSDAFSRFQVRAAQSDFIQDTDLTYLDISKIFQTGLTRLAGTIPFDMYASTGLGMYDSMRDAVDTTHMTDIASVITATGAGTLYSLRRQLLVLQ